MAIGLEHSKKQTLEGYNASDKTHYPCKFRSKHCISEETPENKTFTK